MLPTTTRVGATAKAQRSAGSGTYANWEYGIRDPDTDTLVNLAKIFEVTTDYLTGASDTIQFAELDELDRKLMQAIRSLSKSDKEYVLGFVERIGNKSI